MSPDSPSSAQRHPTPPLTSSHVLNPIISVSRDLPSVTVDAAPGTPPAATCVSAEMDGVSATQVSPPEAMERDRAGGSSARFQDEQQMDSRIGSSSSSSSRSCVSNSAGPSRATAREQGQRLQRDHSVSSSSAAEVSVRRLSLSAVSHSVDDRQPILALDQSSLGSGDEFRQPSRRKQVTRSERAPMSSKYSSASRKGKERKALSMDGSHPSPRTGDRAAHRTESSLASVERRLPLRTRRVGALGISVSSESEDGSTEKMREMDWSADGLESTDLDSLGSLVRIANGIGVNESHFRGIVDDLTVQNKLLKGRLRKYEVAKGPVELKKDRMFEVKFFDGMPSDKRKEIESFLALYVQGLAPLPSTIAPTPEAVSSMISPIKSSSLRSQPIATAASRIDLFIPPFVPSQASPASTSRPLSKVASIASSIPSTSAVIARPPASRTTKAKDPNRRSRQRRQLTDREILAAPSYAGIEPISLSGTGSGMRMKALANARKPSASSIARAKLAREENALDLPKAMEIVSVLEELFSDSLHRETGGLQGSNGGSSRGTTNDNEAHLAILIDRVDNLEGWVYLRLLFTLAGLHRYSVTLQFIVHALLDHSTRLQLSADNSMIRWIGPKPDKVETSSPSLKAKVESRARERDTDSTKSRTESEAGSVSISALLSAPSLSNSAMRADSTAATSIDPSFAKSLHHHHHHHHHHRQHAVSTVPSRAVSIRATDTALPTPTDVTSLSAPSLLTAYAVRSSHFNYTPLFDRKEASILDSLDSLSETQSDEIGRSRTRDDQGQVVVFYANQPFCSDLSKDLETVRMCEEGRFVDVESSMKDVFRGRKPDDSTNVVDEHDLTSDDGLDAGVKGDDDDSMVMSIYDDSSSILQSIESNVLAEIEEHQLKLSGMNEVVARDYFTLSVDVLHYRLPTTAGIDSSTAVSSKKRKFDLSSFQLSSASAATAPDEPSKRQKRPTTFCHRVLASNVHHHYIQSVERRGGEDDYQSSGSSEAGSISSRGSRRAEPVVPEITTTDYAANLLVAPPPDYLSSLSFPFWSWAPHRTNLALMGRESSPGRSSSAVRTNFDGDGDGGDEDARDEVDGPIDLESELKR